VSIVVVSTSPLFRSYYRECKARTNGGRDCCEVMMAPTVPSSTRCSPQRCCATLFPSDIGFDDRRMTNRLGDANEMISSSCRKDGWMMPQPKNKQTNRDKSAEKIRKTRCAGKAFIGGESFAIGCRFRESPTFEVHSTFFHRRRQLFLFAWFDESIINEKHHVYFLVALFLAGKAHRAGCRL
jgi:hypothetical protein